MLKTRIERTTDYKQEIFVFLMYSDYKGAGKKAKWFMKIACEYYCKKERVNIKGEFVTTQELEKKPRGYIFTADIIDEVRADFCKQIMRIEI